MNNELYVLSEDVLLSNFSPSNNIKPINNIFNSNIKGNIFTKQSGNESALNN